MVSGMEHMDRQTRTECKASVLRMLCTQGLFACEFNKVWGIMYDRISLSQILTSKFWRYWNSIVCDKMYLQFTYRIQCSHYLSCFDEQTRKCVFDLTNKKKVKWSHYRPGVAQRVGRGIVLLFHDRGTRRGWVVSSTPRPHFTPRKEPVPILQEVWWAPGSVWTGGKSRPHWDSVPDRPARSQLLYRLRYLAHLI